MRKFALSMKLLGLMLCFVFGSPAFAQEKTVSGTVLADDDGTPLVGVTITNATTNKKTQTNQAGYFSIAAEKGQKLAFTYVGYVAKEVIVADSKIISTRMVNSDKDLGNVVVTGYGNKQSKRSLSYQAPVVSGDEIAQAKRDNFINALAGRVPGLTVTSTSGTPGASAQIILRGATSISGNNSPLFVIDGVPMDNSVFNQQDNLTGASNPNGVGFANRNSDYTNRIADISPDDIEEITILKGPEAAALYGSDGASGAIIITTKKGAAGRMRVSYDNSFRVEQVYRYPQVQTVYNRGSNGIYNPEAYSTIYGFKFFGPTYNVGSPLYDNIKNFFKNGNSQQHNLSFESGNNEGSYRFSSSYLKTNGVVPNTSLERMTFRLTANTKLGKKINMFSSWSYSYANNIKSPKGAGTYYTNLITYPSDVDARNYANPDGTRTRLKSGDNTAEFENPFWDVNKNSGQDKTDRLSGNFTFASDPYKWLNLATTFGLDHFTTEGYYMIHPYSRLGFYTNGFLSTYIQNYRNLNGTFKATFKKTIAKKINNTLFTGFYFEDSKRSVPSQAGEQFFERDFISIVNTAPLTRNASLLREQIRKVRAFANYSIGYNNMLYGSLSFVREGVSTLASKFYDKQPFFNYGSASGSFIFTELNGLKKMKWLNYGKLRVSYATTGKAPYSAYRTDPQFAASTFTGGGYGLGVYASNPDLKPEFTKNFEIGGELKLFKNRISIDIAYYRLGTTDQLISNRLSYATTGVLKFINGGEVKNKGIEIQLKASVVKNKNFNWDVTVNFDKNKSTVVRLPADLPLYYNSDTWVFGAVRSEVSAGVSTGNLVGTGFQRNNNGDLIISTTTGLPLPTSTYINMGDRTPDFKMGIINTFTIYKDFSLSFNLDIRKGGIVFNGNEAMMMITGTSKNTLDRLQPRVIKGVLADGLQNTSTPTVNTISITPYYRNDYYDGAFAEQDFTEDVNWLRMRDITLGYRLSDKLLKRQKALKSAAVFVTVTDLFMITNYSGVDPNVNAVNPSTGGIGGMGIDYGSIANPRGINFGIKVQF